MSEALQRIDGASEEAPTRGLSRRQLVQAGVWAAPVVVLATAAPASAAVSSDAITVSAVLIAVPASGNGLRVWNFRVNVANPSTNSTSAAPTVFLSATGVIHAQSPANPAGPYTTTVAPGFSAESGQIISVTTSGNKKSITVTPSVTFSGETFPVTIVPSPQTS